MTTMTVELGTCAASEWRDGALLVAPDGKGKAADGTRGAIAPSNPIQPLGLYAVPRDPETDTDGEVGEGAQALYFTQGDDTHVMPVTDLVAIGNVPQGQPGSCCLYAPSARTSYHYLSEDGYQQILTAYDDGQARSHSLTLDPTGDEPNIALVHGKGGVVRLLNNGSIYLAADDGKAWIEIKHGGEIVINADKVTILGATAAGGDGGSEVFTKADAQLWLAPINATIAGATCAAPGSPLVNSVPLSFVPPGSTKMKLVP